MGKSLDAKIKEIIKDKEQEELKLFRSYNRHATADVKLEVLENLKQVISELKLLKNLA
jgi:hypothetical protein